MPSDAPARKMEIETEIYPFKNGCAEGHHFPYGVYQSCDGGGYTCGAYSGAILQCGCYQMMVVLGGLGFVLGR
jgi:hypothetical protein